MCTPYRRPPILGSIAVPLATLGCVCWLVSPLRAQEANGGPDSSYAYQSADGSISVTLPDKSWKLSDKSAGIATVLVFSPHDDLRERCSVLVLPKLMLPKGLVTREAQVKMVAGDKYRRESLEDTAFAERQGQHWIYWTGKAKTIEWGFAEGSRFVIFQLSAPEETWSQAASTKRLDAIRDSFRFDANVAQVTTDLVDRSTVAEVRKRREEQAQSRRTRPFELEHHDIRVTVDPAGQRLTAEDTMTVIPRVPNLKAIDLYTTVVRVDSVHGDGIEAWDSQGNQESKSDRGDRLRIRWKEPLPEGEKTTVRIVTSSSDYFSEVDQKLVEEVAVLGQVRERSSYSSHVAYYPIDDWNDASVQIAVRVPEGYTAVCGGELLSTRTADGWTTSTYTMRDRRQRLLPLGFAVARYVTRNIASPGGLNLTIYGYPGELDRMQQRLDVGIEAVGLLEKLMGRLPWSDVRVAHVTPTRKETGVSLPGLILLSDAFFQDISQVDLSDGNLDRRDSLNLLVVADELSHQWNIYAANLPNELGEGISTFTNILFVEQRHGAQAYRNALARCFDAYRASVAIDRDIAIADPNVYTTSAYRGIVFCKTPLILAMLRDRMGDEPFFQAWREAFAGMPREQDGFDALEESFRKTTGEDLGWFFEQWFYRAGYPKLRLEQTQAGAVVAVRVEQVQPGPAYRLTVPLRLTGKDPQSVQKITVEMRDRQHEISLDCSFPVERVELDRDRTVLAD